MRSRSYDLGSGYCYWGLVLLGLLAFRSWANTSFELGPGFMNSSSSSESI